jgi:ribosomal-protein-alanine N-acetyltransferase
MEEEHQNRRNKDARFEEAQPTGMSDCAGLRGILQNDYCVRHFREGDLSQLLKVENEAFPLDAYTGAMLRERISTYPEGFWVVLKGDEVVAYIAAWILKGQARIDTMAVASRHREKGIGSLLLGMAIEHFAMQGCRDVELEARPSNVEAVRLYERFGFRVVGLKPGYYTADNGDALLMRRDLRGSNDAEVVP